MTAVTAFYAPTRVDLVASEPAIRFEAVSKAYAATKASPEVVALDDVSLTVDPGSIYGVIGRSGAGKSTLIRAINGLERVTAGRVVVDGTEVGALGERELRALRRRIGMIFQHFNLLASRTAFDNVALPLELAGVDRARIRSRVSDLLGLVGLADKAHRYPAELSGGQKQRVGIARALATEPKVLLSDEATSALDPETTGQILALLRRVNEVTGVTIVLITHEMHVIKQICDRVAVIERGRVIEEGPTYEVLARPRTETARAFVASVAGSDLPEEIGSRLVADPSRAHKAVLRIVFTGEHATAPVLSRLSRTLDIDVNIIAGKVDQIGRAPFGNLIVSIPAPEGVVAAAVDLIHGHGLDTEVLGYVA